MALQITITDAGRAEIVNAQNTGTGPVAISQVGVGTGQYAPSKSQPALQGEIKRLGTIGGQVVADDTIHVTVKDEGADAYDVGEFGLFSASGTLVAVYSQSVASGWIIEKASASTLLLAVDIVLESLDAASLTFGDVVFINPPATTEVQGVVELATDAETQAGTDASRAVTPAALKTLTATEARAGLIELATDAETQTGTDASRAVTPAGLKTLTATTARAGLVRLNDTLTSSSTTQALTAAAGKALQDGKQPLDDTLTALAQLVTAANRLIYATGPDQFSLTDFTAQARTFLAAVDQAAQRTALGLGTAATRSVTATPYDTTAARLLQVGDGGINTPIQMAYGQDPNIKNGFYRFPASPGNSMPLQASASLLHVEYDANNAWQIGSLAGYGGGYIFANLKVGGIWETVEFFTSGNQIRLGTTPEGARQAIGAAPLDSPAFVNTPTAPTPAAGDNSQRLSTTAFVQAAIAALVNSSPAALDTLSELAASLGNDPNFATTVLNALAGKVNRDSISDAGFANGDAGLPYFRSLADGTVYLLQRALGFTPVRQGGGAYQQTNTVYIGFDGADLRAQVDATDFGALWSAHNAAYKLAAMEVGSIGTYALCLVGGGSAGVAVPAGTLVSGSNLRYAAASGAYSGTLDGTWSVCGFLYDANLDDTNSVTLCKRVS